MPKLISFTSVSLDGYFTDAKGDMSWAHTQDPEWNAFVAGNASGGGKLLFGRVTYDMMVKFWPTPAATQTMPEVAAGMNAMPKVVFSKKMSRADWQNTTVKSGPLLDEVRALKSAKGPDMAILGSGSIVAQLAGEGLIDEIQIVVVPLILGQGRSLFEGVSRQQSLNLTSSRTFKNGYLFNCYAPRR